MTYELCGGQNRLNTDPQIEKYLFPIPKGGERKRFVQEGNEWKIDTNIQITDNSPSYDG